MEVETVPIQEFNIPEPEVTTETLAMAGPMMVVALAVAVILLASMWKIFTKASKPGWAALIPIYNIYVLLQIVGRPTWWLVLFLLGIIPLVGPLLVFAVSIIVAIDLAKSFGKSPAFGVVGLVLFSVIGYPMLAFGDAKYSGPSVSSGQSVANPTDPADKK